MPGLGGLDYNKLAAQLKGQKSFVQVATGNDLQHELLYDYSSADTSSTTTPAPTADQTVPAIRQPTDPLPNRAPVEIAVDPAVKAALAKKYPDVLNLQIVWKVSDAPVEKLVKDTETSLGMSGYASD